MRFTIALRRKFCRSMVGAVALAQLSISSYACPRTTDPVAHPMTSSVPATPCDAMDTPRGSSVPESHDAVASRTEPLAADGARCLEHCRYGQQSNASTPSPVVHAAFLVSLYPMVAVPASPSVGRNAVDEHPPAATAAPPPLAILHCCFRI